MNNTLRTHPTPLARSELDINNYGSSLSFDVSRSRTQSLPSIRLRNVRQSSWILEYIYKITYWLFDLPANKAQTKSEIVTSRRLEKLKFKKKK